MKGGLKGWRRCSSSPPPPPPPVGPVDSVNLNTDGHSTDRQSSHTSIPFYEIYSVYSSGVVLEDFLSLCPDVNSAADRNT